MPGQFSSLVRVVFAFALAMIGAIVWVVAADKVYGNKVPLQAMEFHLVYTLITGVAAVLTIMIFESDYKSFHFSFPELRFFGYAAFTAIAITFIPFTLNMISGMTVKNGAPFTDQQHLMFVFFIMFALATAEEMLWRGYIFSSLSKMYNHRKISVAVGIMSALFYFPMIIHTRFINEDFSFWVSLPLYDYATRPLWFSLFMFLVLNVSLSFVYTYFRVASKSLWGCVFLHALINYFLFNFIGQMESPAGTAGRYFINDIGIFYVATAIAAAFVFQYLLRLDGRKKKRRKRSSPSSSRRHRAIPDPSDD